MKGGVYLRRIAASLCLGLGIATDLSAQNEVLPERVGEGIPMSDGVVELRLTLLQTTNAFGADFYRRFKEAEKSHDERALSDSIKMLRALCAESGKSHTLGDVVIRQAMSRPFQYTYRSDEIEVRQTNDPTGWTISGSVSPNQGRNINLSLRSRYFDGDMGDGIEMVSIQVSGTGTLSNGWPRVLSRWSSSSRDIFLLAGFHRSPADKVLFPPIHHTWINFDTFRNLIDESDQENHFRPLLESDKRELITRFSSELIDRDEFGFVNGYSSSRSKRRAGDFLLMAAPSLKRPPRLRPRHPWFLPKIRYPLDGSVTFFEPYGRYVNFPYTRGRRPRPGDINRHYISLRGRIPLFTLPFAMLDGNGPVTGATFEIESYEDSQILAPPKLDETFLIQK